MAGSIASHMYGAEGDYTIRVFASNGNYQEARATMPVHVGVTPPSFLETAFAPDNQEATFFALGLIVTFLLTGFGLAARRRRHSILRRELEAADNIVAEHQNKPDVMRERLRRHRARAEKLFMQNRIDEAASNMLRSHIDDLLRSHRMGIVEEKLSFLPHGLFRALQEILRDAQITALERNEFLKSLKDETALTAAQKKKVRVHIDTWAQQDASA